MRKNSVNRILGAAVLIAPLMVACGSDGAGGGGGGGTGDGSVPTCDPGYALSTSGTKIVCKKLPDGSVVLPTCTAGSEALTSNGQGLACTSITTGSPDDPAVVARIDAASSKITDLGTKIDAIGAMPGSARSFVGVTTNAANKLNGNMQNGTDNGFTGAAKACNAEYPGAVMCTVWDIYNSAVGGALSSTKNIASPAWIYFPGWNNPIAGSVDANNGQGDTCGSLTYPTGDKKWTGIAVTTGINAQTTRWGVNLLGGTSAPCSTALPIACCK